MTLIDDSTIYCRVYLLKSKDEALKFFKIYKAEVENQLDRKIKRLRSDHGGEYFSNEFDAFCAEHGIIHERMPPYSPQSYGVDERKNRTLTDLVNAMLDTSGLSKAWWGKAILTACHVLNRVPTKNKEITPFEGMGEEKVKALLSMNLGLFGESQCANSKEAQAWTKNRRLCFPGICFS